MRRTRTAMRRLRKIAIASAAASLALALSTSTADAESAWWARTGVANYNPNVERAGIEVYYTCPEVSNDTFNGAIRVEMRQGDTTGEGDEEADCPNSRAQRIHIGVGKSGDFDPDKLAQVQVQIGEGFGTMLPAAMVKYTSDWHTVCLHGGSAERCPQG